MIRLFDNDTETEIGAITDKQFDDLQEELVEETIDAYTYNITADVIDSLELNEVDAEMVALLRRSLGARTSMEIRYESD